MTSTLSDGRVAEDSATPAVALPVVPSVRKRPSVVVYLCYFWLFLIIFCAIFANLLPITHYSLAVGGSRQAPELGSLDLLLGTDSSGRSMLSRCIYGARVSLLIGTIATVVGMTIGTVLGLLGGYLGRSSDWVIRLLTDAMLAFPPLILLLALTTVLEPSATSITLGLTLVSIPAFIRLARANTVSWASRDFVRAARNMGASNIRILGREILPNVLPSLAAFVPTVIAALIVAEGSLSFLGLGLPAPTPTWGGLINDGQVQIQNTPLLVVIPAVIIFLTVFALNQAGDHLRVRFDATMRD